MNRDVLLHQNTLGATLRQDLYSFVQGTFSIVETHHPFLPNWHIDAMCCQLEQVLQGESKRLVITVPPRSLKSICCSVLFPAFALGHDPTLKFICVSYSQSLSEKHARDCRAVMHSTIYRRLFRTRISRTKDNDQEFTTTSGGLRLATSVGGTLTGRGGNIVVIDDPLNPQEAMSDLARANVTNWYSNTLLSRLDNKTQDTIIVVMQRLHEDDFVAYLLNQPGWTHLNLPAIAETETIIPLTMRRQFRRSVGNVIHPEREPLGILEQYRREMGSMDFSAQYQQAPVAPGGNLVKWSWFNFYDSPPDIQPTDTIVVSWDTALSAKELSSYSVCVILQVRGESVYVRDVIRERLEYPELKKKVLEVHAQWTRLCKKYELLIEDKGSGMSLIQDLRRSHIHPIAVVPKGDKAIRMNAQTARIEAGAIFLPKRVGWLDEFKRELLAFPMGQNNDQVDALSQALNHAFNSPRNQIIVASYVGMY